ncbi:autophagy-related protein 7 [Hordeum vulgare]|nr:autophagy-related protein 7 [Hordeum vulgare]
MDQLLPIDAAKPLRLLPNVVEQAGWWPYSLMSSSPTAYSYLLHCNDALESDVTAVLEGLSMSMQESGLSIVIQSDSSCVVAALSDDSMDRSVYGYEIKIFIEFRGFIPQNMEARQNKVAHGLANIDHSNGSPACWLRRVLESVAEIISRL